MSDSRRLLPARESSSAMQGDQAADETQPTTESPLSSQVRTGSVVFEFETGESAGDHPGQYPGPESVHPVQPASHQGFLPIH